MTQKNMRVTRTRSEKLAHMVIVAAMTVSMTASMIIFIGGSSSSISGDAGPIFLLSVMPWLFLVVMTIFLNVGGSVHHRFTLWAMLLSLIGIVLSGVVFPAIP